MKVRRTLTLLALVALLLLTGCMTPRRGGEEASRSLTSRGTKNPAQLANFFLANRPDADKALVKRLARYYVEEAAAENINSDCAWVQMCLETGWLSFTGLVKPEMHNYCGLGAMDAEHPGVSFETEQLGVRAHIQHLHAYATKEGVALNRELVDPRYKYVLPRGKAPTIYGLAGTWAADKEYGIKLDKLLSRLEDF